MRNIVIFGDSVTWGRGLKTRQGWANLLRNVYEKPHHQEAALYDLGIDANTSDDLAERFDVEAKARKPEVIIFAIGVNDAAFRGNLDNPLVPLDRFIDNMKTLVEKARSYSGDHLLCVAPVKGSDQNTNPLPDSSTGKCYTKARVAKYVSALKEVCASSGVKLVDPTEVLIDEDFYDGLHPNEAGHEKIFNLVEPELKRLLEK